MIPKLLPVIFLLSGFLVPVGIQAGTFSGAGELNGLDAVRHPKGYDGTGGDLILTVCLDSGTAPAAAEIPLYYAIQAWNAAVGATANLSSTVGVPGTALDFQSVALRGLGGCLGLDDPSDASGFTRATDGDNDAFELDDGIDNVPGTADDQRGDDGGLFWFRIADNSPFQESLIVDSSTFSRDPAQLPEGEDFANTSTRAVALQLGFVGTESVMVNALQTGEAKRSLSWDDQATLSFGQSGLDEIAGTADDYRVSLRYIGFSDSCDISVRFDIQESLVACPGSLGSTGTPGHFTANLLGFLAFSDEVNWFFEDYDIFFFDGFETGDTSRWSLP